MTIAAKLRQYLRTNFIFGSDDRVADGDSLLDAGIIDSTGVMELVSFLEQEFGIQVDDQDLVPENLDSIDALAAFVTRKLTLQGQPQASQLGANT
jgi:acyl carrier protein